MKAPGEAADARSPRVPADARLGFGDAALALWRLARPEAWMVTFLPVYIGHVLATRELFPGQQRAAQALRDATTTGITTRGAWDALVDVAAAAGPLVLGLVVMGPLVWTATLLWNDVHDLPGDRVNPRKAASPLVQGIVTAGWADRVAYVAAASCLAAALVVGITFTVLVAACLALAWLYSVPPVRLKTRPGADVAVNAIGIGLLAGLAGWSISRPVTEFPFHLAPQAILVAVAVYVPTTLVDREADAAAGYLTLATHLGDRRAYLVGWWSWVAAAAGSLLLSATDTVIPRAMLPIVATFVPLLLWQYHTFIGKARDGPARVKGIILCSLTFLVVNALFALVYTGLWRI